MILAVLDAIFSDCIRTSEKFKTSTGLEPVASRHRCDAQTNLSYEPTDVG